MGSRDVDPINPIFNCICTEHVQTCLLASLLKHYNYIVYVQIIHKHLVIPYTNLHNTHTLYAQKLLSQTHFFKALLMAKTANTF